jgi:hypothetical protein
MVMREQEQKRIIEFVKKEPRTIQEISRVIKRSWVTTDSYVRDIKERTGLIDVKTFRPGTQAALKIAFYQSAETVASDDTRENLFEQIRHGRSKQDFDFLEVYQYVPEKRKRAFIEDAVDEAFSVNSSIVSLFRGVKRTIFCFSGNLSFINMEKGKVRIIDIVEDLLKAGVQFKILCRVNIASIGNIKRLAVLAKNYPGLIEIRHCYQPLRGFIIDDRIACFKNEEQLKSYRAGELGRNSRVFYEITDTDWVLWLQKVFWAMFKVSVDHDVRMREMSRIR